MQRLACLALFSHALAFSAGAQTLNVLPRLANAPTGTEFISLITPLSLTDRENFIYSQILSGNVPDFMRALVPVTVSANIGGTNHTATYYVTPDYVAIGSDEDHFLEPMTPIVAQQLADALDCTLPTRKMVNQIWTNATVKLNPQPIPPSAEMTTVPVFAQHNSMVRTQRLALTNSQPLGRLVSGDKKDVIISNEIYNRPPPPRVIIYGWHYPDGTPIQPLSGAHEATYADYSHGVRLVQNACIVNGTTQTVAQVLANPNLAALLSDEGTIAAPRYPAQQSAPIITTHLRSQSVIPGAQASFNARVRNATGLQWQRNGTNLAGAASAALALTNIQAANAGLYALVASNSFGAVTSRPARLTVNTNLHPSLFRDDFETNSSSRWDLFEGSANGIPDYTVEWAFNYGITRYTVSGAAYVIPPAPNSPDGSTRGVRLTVNNNDATGAPAGVNIYPKNHTFGSNYALKSDLWLNYPGGAGGINSTGSTEHAIFGINHFGTQANWAAPSTASSDGIWFAVDGEGGTSRDYRAYLGNPLGTQIELIGYAASGLAESNNTAPIYQDLFPASRFESAGAPGKNWVEVEVLQANGMILWKLDGTVIAQRTNASAFTAGTVMLGLMDTFSSIANPAEDAFVIFDNVRVEDLTVPPARFDSVTKQPDGSIRLVFSGVPGETYWLETSTNLTAWQALTPLIGSNSPITFDDTTATDHPRRFYRSRKRRPAGRG